MTPTDGVLGQLAAIQTFIENFPMSILDMMHGKTYTSIFDFLIDVLNACGVNTNEIIDYLLSEIYGVEASINGSINGFYEQIKNGEIELEEQNEFMESLEMGIKGVFMALLSSIFTCSAIPVLPNKVFDKPNPDSFSGKGDTLGYELLSSQRFVPFIVPTSIIDPMGLLTVCPTSEDGRLFYDIQGRDVYYKKEYVETTLTIEEIIEATSEETEPVTTQREATINVLDYVQCQYEDVIEDNLVRVDFVPEQKNVSLDSPDFIVHYEGLNPNTLYKTMDMNAFMWYALHKGMKTPQVEYNHMMWDSRISAAKEGNGRQSASEWNEWYNSKKVDNGEFTYSGKPVTNKSPIYPIIQLEPQGMAENLFRIHIPSQTYWMPKVRESKLGLIDKSPRVASNASIYKFNWDYLTNIRILQPKLLLV